MRIDVVFYGVHDVDVRFQAGAETAVVVFLQLHGKGDHAVL